MNFGWQREQIVEFLEKMVHPEFTAKTVSALLLDEIRPSQKERHFKKLHFDFVPPFRPTRDAQN